MLNRAFGTDVTELDQSKDILVINMIMKFCLSIYTLSLHLFYLSNTSVYTIFFVLASTFSASQIALMLDIEVTLETPT